MQGHSLPHFSRRFLLILVYKVRFVLEIVDVDDSAPEIINERMPLVGFAPLDTQPRAQILQLTIRDPDAKPEEPSDRQWTVEIGNYYREKRQNLLTQFPTLNII